MYVKFPGGNIAPGGYIVPCDVIRHMPGWTQVKLTAAPPNHIHHWKQWVRNNQILTDQEAEAE